jgi:hypothetical protein
MASIKEEGAASPSENWVLLNKLISCYKKDSAVNKEFCETLNFHN